MYDMYAQVFLTATNYCADYQVRFLSVAKETY